MQLCSMSVQRLINVTESQPPPFWAKFYFSSHLHTKSNHSPTCSHGLHHQSLDSWSTNAKNKFSFLLSLKYTFHIIRVTYLYRNCRSWRRRTSTEYIFDAFNFLIKMTEVVCYSWLSKEIHIEKIPTINWWEFLVVFLSTSCAL